MTTTNEVQALPEEGKIVIATYREAIGHEVEGRAALEISSRKCDGIESRKGGANTTVRFIGVPRYRLVMSAENVGIVENLVSNAVEKIRIAIEKHYGTFSSKSEQSMVFQSGHAR